jgi:hypothetical protein
VESILWAPPSSSATSPTSTTLILLSGSSNSTVLSGTCATIATSQPDESGHLTVLRPEVLAIVIRGRRSLYQARARLMFAWLAKGVPNSDNCRTQDMCAKERAMTYRSLHEEENGELLYLARNN